jgi:hypothetical protein
VFQSILRIAGAIAALAVGPVVVACQAPISSIATSLTAGDPADPYRGMSKEEIIACAGKPASIYPRGSGETLVYHYNGAGPVPGSGEKKAPEKDKKKKNDGSDLFSRKSGGDWTCTASIAFEGGRLARVTYAHHDAISPYEQKRNPTTGKKEYVTPPPPCAFSLPNCVRR